MFNRVMSRFFGSYNERRLKQYWDRVGRIHEFQNDVKKLSDSQFQEKTAHFRERYVLGETLDALLPETFALVQEAAFRSIGLRHFDVQFIGGMVLHEGKIAEMKTGEGKTLVATLPAYLNALSGNGVHIITVNDYLAKRDATWMKPVYEMLGLSVGVIQHDMNYQQRKAAYDCNVVYGTNNEFGFDYLRDAMVEHPNYEVQRVHHFCIVDEVDSILIDEARTPLIISGAAEEFTDLYYQINRIIPKLKPASKGPDGKWLPDSGDYQFEEKDRNIVLSEEGIAKVERLFGVENLYAAENIHLVHHVNQALKAHIVFKRDVDYIVENGHVMIIDEHTGRKMHGRRYSDGLHQALEAKENVRIEKETQTLASITFQNYFRLYEKLSGMTGTADTEAEEFYKIYALSVVVIPTHLPMCRIDYPDRIYRTEREKFNAIIQEIKDCHHRGQPVLVGTISIEKNEHLSKLLKREGIPHNVLNAKFHDKEAYIIAQGGHKSAITIATNMAGRGTDIQLGEGVKELGGLHIIGTERHEARRIDNQLRGRSGRQGDPGSSRFYLSLEDALMRLFGSDRISTLVKRLGMGEGQEIEHPWISKAIANAQCKVEGRNFEIRKVLLEYDDVMNRQRQYIYTFRKNILHTTDTLRSVLMGVIRQFAIMLLQEFSVGSGQRMSPDEFSDCAVFVNAKFGIGIEEAEYALCSTKKEYEELLAKRMTHVCEVKESIMGAQEFHTFTQFVFLHVIDSKWKEHLHALDGLKEGVHLQAYAEKNPLTEYKLESSAMFETLKYHIYEAVIEFLCKIHPEKIHDSQNLLVPTHHVIGQEKHDPLSLLRDTPYQPKKGLQQKAVKIGRNDPCFCGSGVKYKRCCGK